MKLTVAKGFPHRLEPIHFAHAFAAARAKAHGIRFQPEVAVFNTSFDGRGYAGRASVGPAHRQFVRLRIAKRLPAHVHVYPRFKGMPKFVINGGPESMVYLAAHEFGHNLGWPGGRDGEKACCLFGYAAVMAWRERENEHPACLI